LRKKRRVLGRSEQIWVGHATCFLPACTTVEFWQLCCDYSLFICMSGSSNKSQNGSPKILRASGTGRGAAIHQINPMTSPALEGTSFISPRTPRGGRYSFDRTSDDDVELRLLGEDDQRRAANGIDDTPYYKGEPKRISSRDKRNMVLLCVLCEFGVICFHSLCLY
jgi:hypothetical protein